MRQRVARYRRVAPVALTVASLTGGKLPASTNSPITVAGNVVLVPAGAPKTSAKGGESPQLVAYTVAG